MLWELIALSILSAVSSPVPAPPATSERVADAMARLALKDFETWDAALNELGTMGTEAVPALIEALESPELLIQVRACRALEMIGPDAVEAIPALVSLTKNDREFSTVTGKTLGCIGREALPAIIELLKSDDRNLVQNACRAIEAMGPDAKDTLPLLLNRIESDNSTEICEAIRAIGRDAVEPLLTLLQEKQEDEETNLTSDVAHALSFMDEAVIPDLVKALETGNTQVQLAMLETLRDYGDKAAPAVPALIKILQKEDSAAANVRINEIVCVDDTEYPDEDGEPAGWLELFNERKTPVSMEGWGLTDEPAQPHKWMFPAYTIPNHAFVVIHMSGKDRRPAGGDRMHANFKLNPQGGYVAIYDSAGNLVSECEYPEGEEGTSWAEFKDEDRVPEMAAFVLQFIGPAARPAVPALIRAVADWGEQLCDSGVNALGAIGPDARDAVPLLRQMAQSQVEETQLAAEAALRKIQPREYALSLAAQLHTNNLHQRQKALDALVYADDAEPALPDVIPLLQDSIPLTRNTACQVLGNIGPAAAETVPQLVEMLGSGGDLSHEAADALGKIGPAAKDAIPVLESMLHGNVEDIRHAQNALCGIGPDAAGSVGLIIEALPLDQTAIGELAKMGPAIIPQVKAVVLDVSLPLEQRCFFIEILARMKSEADSAIPMLIELTKDSDRHLRGNAALALGSVAKDAPEVIAALEEMKTNDSDWTNRKRAQRALHDILPDKYQDIRNIRHRLWYWEPRQAPQGPVPYEPVPAGTRVQI